MKSHSLRQYFLGLVIPLVVFSALKSTGAIAMGRSRLPSPEVVDTVDLNRYAGDWFEIAHNANWFQRGCASSTAHYDVLDPTHVAVKNTCYRANGSRRSILGQAVIFDPAVPAKLQVKFHVLGFIPVRGAYWIVELGKNYEYAVVSGPGKKSLFILSRTAPMPTEQLQNILESLKNRGFKLDRLVFDRYADAALDSSGETENEANEAKETNDELDGGVAASGPVVSVR